LLGAGAGANIASRNIPRPSGSFGDLYPDVSGGDEVSEYDLVNPPTTRDLLKKASVIVSCADAGG
jgi:hypothetical protein